MSVQKLTIVPNQTLRKKSIPVEPGKKLLSIVKDLSDTIAHQDNPKGVGLSAPQIGKNWDAFVTYLAPNLEEEANLSHLRVFLNPKIIGVSNEMTLGADEEEPILEGCLSIPNIYGPVPRHEWIELEYDIMTEDGFKKMQEKFTDFFARVVQHEYDHLRGVLFTDYSLKGDLPVYEYRKRKMVEIDKSVLKVF